MEEQFAQRLQRFVELRTRRRGTINAMLGMELVEYDAASKQIVLRFWLEPWAMNPADHTHGGIISTIADMTMGAVAYASATAVFTPTIQLAVTFVKGTMAGQWLYAEGICDHCGSRTALTRAIIRTEDGSVAATASGSYALNQPRKE